ncbi:ACP S-malonyltransferase [Clostridiisalibacter paucivorans]|uniref:ACP S-malonyltransferase n=1 Tax=Clostridiisalibacter paucivorans TaxID=408753 RepID=UPI00047B78CB|nr:ACP S-malonyltransferase [Clostridiisalibacter paucivorans]
MGKIAIIYPGQGAQYLGMGKDIVEKSKEAKKIFDIANEFLGFNISKMCFEGPESDLVKTENTQPAILTVCMAITKVLEELGFKADITGGLSLGEYGSLVYGGVLDFADAIKIVKLRGKYMQEAVPIGRGTMAALIGLERDKINDVLDEASKKGIVEAANFNCPGQIVISGEIDAVESACEIAKENGCKRAIRLPVSAPFHCSLLKPAGDKLKLVLNDVDFNQKNKDIISSVTGDYISEDDNIKDILVSQVYKSVLWQDVTEKMINDGVETFVEVGPGKTLTTFTKKTSRKMKKKVKCYNVECMDDILKIKKELL